MHAMGSLRLDYTLPLERSVLAGWAGGKVQNKQRLILENKMNIAETAGQQSQN